MPDDTRPRVVKLKLTCPSVPAQWEGETDDGRFIIIRNRYGSTWVGIGSRREEAIENCISMDPFYFGADDADLDGNTDYPELVSLLRDHLVLPDESEVENDWK